MLVIKEEQFEMVQTSESGPFFDLSVPTKINEGKDNERTELKLIGHGLPFDVCMKHIVGLKMADIDGVYTIAEYIEKYKTVVDEVSKMFKVEEKPIKVKTKIEDGESE